MCPFSSVMLSPARAPLSPAASSRSEACEPVTAQANAPLTPVACASPARTAFVPAADLRGYLAVVAHIESIAPDFLGAVWANRSGRAPDECALWLSTIADGTHSCAEKIAREIVDAVHAIRSIRREV